MKTTLLILVLLSAAVLAACQSVTPPGEPSTAASTIGQPDPTGPLKEFTIRGEIVSVDREAKSATIKHQDIEGFMNAMTMIFPVPEESDLEKIEPGSHIVATVYQRPSDSRYWVGAIEVQEAPAEEAPQQ